MGVKKWIDPEITKIQNSPGRVERAPVLKAKSNINKNYKSPYSIILTVFVLCALGIYIYRNQDLFAALGKISVLDFIILIGTYAAFILSLSYLNKLIFQKLDPRIKTREIIGLQFVNNLLNKVLPKGGVAFRAMYLKRNYQLSYAFFLASFAGLVLLSIAAQALVSLVAMLWVYIQTSLLDPLLLFGFGGLLLGTIGIMLFKPQFSSEGNWVLKQIKMLAEGWNIVVQNPREILLYISVSVVILMIDALNMLIIFRALEIQITYSEAIILSSLSIIFSYVNITPDGLGIREVAYLYITSILTMSNPQIVLGSLTQRAVSLVAALLFGGISYLALVKDSKEKIPLSG